MQSESGTTSTTSTSTNQRLRKQSRTKGRTQNKSTGVLGKRGRPRASTIVYRDLVIIPDPETKKVPTHAARLALEKNKLIVSGFPFDRSWDGVTLKTSIREQLPTKDMLYECVKVSIEFKR